MIRWNAALRSVLVCPMVAAAGPLFFAAVAPGQQLQDQTATRFPPDPLEYTNQLTIGDIDGDGDLDLIFANGGGFSSANPTGMQLRVYINNGSGTFTDESATRAAGALFWARGAELGDVDGDGDLDIIVAQDFDKQPQLLINNGSGVFTNQTVTRLPLITLSSSRGQFADVENDGDLDIYLVNGGAVNRFGTGQGRLYLNNGLGVFIDATGNMPNETVSEPQDCIFGDIDGDLDLDLRISSTASNQGKIYKNNGSGVFTVASSPSDNNCYSYDFGDIDGDGDLDMLGVNANPITANAELLLRNNGTGSFTSITFPIVTTDDNDSKFFDYDNDGDLDIIIASLGATERIYTNNGAGSYVLASGIITAVSDSSLDVKVADLNGDGRLDVVTAQGESGSFVNRIYINVTGPADTIPPAIVRTEQAPNTMNAAGPYYVRAVIYDSMTSDRGFHDKGITLNYSVNAGPTQQAAMKWVGNSEWRGGMPGQSAGSSISYFVTARDFANNLAAGPTLNFSILHPPCPADITGDGTVNVNDLLAVINNWGQSAVTHMVAVGSLEFTPADITVKSGDTVQWNWVEGVHTVTSGTNCTADGRFNMPISGGSVSYTIPLAFNGLIPYFCIPHCKMGMVGSITVQRFAADVNGDGTVNVNDLLAVINSWGPCP